MVEPRVQVIALVLPFKYFLLKIIVSLGIFFILPCIDAYARVDLRTRTYDVPPQELSISNDP